MSSPPSSTTGRKPRVLVVCFDGTSNEYDADNTNVVKLFALLKRDDFDEQLCFYQPGIGTWYDPGVVSPLLLLGAKMLDLAFAAYLSAHVTDGYKFPMQNYRVGDKICIFGFSRGAYTARALGGFLYKVGLLPRDNHAQVHFAYKMYKRTDDEGLTLCAGFKQTYCQNVYVDFMGVWDTVASVGVMAGRTLPFTNANSSIKVFRHALALDERRAKFRPNNYYKFTPAKEDARVNTDEVIERTTIRCETTGSATTSSTSIRKKRSSWNLFKKTEKVQSPANIKPTGKAMAPELFQEEAASDVLEVWFAGCHGDIGGGSVPNNRSQSLANISLRWMVHEIIASGCGIQFDRDALARAKIDFSPIPSNEEVELDRRDALRSRHCQLRKLPLWWLLEVAPLHYSWQDPQANWHRDLSFHLGRGRVIMEKQPLFHRTVKTRMEADEKYSPKARWEKGTEIYVD